MKFAIQANALADAAGFALKAVNPRPANPVLSGIFIEAVPGALRISGFDYEKSSRTQVAAEVEANGHALLSGKIFTQIIQKLGRKVVTVSVDGAVATISAGSAVFRIGTMPAQDFPAMPGLPEPAGTVDGNVLAAAVAQVIGAAATDESLPVLTGVKIVSDGANLVLLTTDRYRLAEVNVPWQPAGPPIEVLVRGKWLNDAVKDLAGETQVLTADSIFGLRSGNRATTAVTMDQDFPKIRSLFPESTDTDVTVDRAELAEVISRVSLVAEKTTPVRFRASGSQLTIDAGTGEGATGEESIPCDLDGTDVVAAFNPGYLAWSLAATPSEQVTFGFQANRGKPALVTGHDGLSHLLMPVRLP